MENRSKNALMELRAAHYAVRGNEALDAVLKV